MTSEGVYEYHLLSCKSYNYEPIYSIDHKLPENNAILFFDKKPDGFEHNAFFMSATGIALKNAFNLTVPFKASAYFITTAGYEFNLESISALSIELRGEYYNLVDGLNICCDDYKIYFSTQKDLKLFLKNRVELDPTIIKAIIPKWKDILVDGIICADKLEAELKVAGVDEKAITKHLSLLEMTRPKALMELIKEIAPLEDVMDNQKTQMYKMLYKAIYDDYKCKGIHVITTNPYNLLQYDNRNLTISFKQIDDYAFKIGIENDNPIRLEGIIKYLIKYISLSGNVGIDYTSSVFYKFIKKVSYNPLSDEEEFIKKLKDQVKDSESIILNGDYISSQELYTAEEAIAKNIKRILDSSSTIKIENKDIEQYEKNTKKTLDKKQKDAIAAINDSNIVVIQGSAGTGKSYLVKCIIDLFSKKHSVNDIKFLLPRGKPLKSIVIKKLLQFIDISDTVWIRDSPSADSTKKKLSLPT